ncbi:MAG: hypothetical protein ACREDR_30200 [Blastocatellia bacterium]
MEDLNRCLSINLRSLMRASLADRLVREGGSWLGHYIDDRPTWTLDSIDSVVGPDRARLDSQFGAVLPGEALRALTPPEFVQPWLTVNAGWPFLTWTGRLSFLGDAEILNRELRRGD